MQYYATFDRREFPLIVVTFTGEHESPQNFEVYLNELSANYDARTPISLIFDASHSTVPKFAYQKLQADWMKVNSQLIKTYCLGTAYVTPSSLLRTALKCVFALQGSPVPFRVFSLKSEAVDWARTLLSANQND